MKAINEITLFVLLCSLISLSYSQTTYTYSLLTNGTCQTAEINQCYPCEYEPGFTTYYYKLVASEYESYGAEGIIYSDSSCNFEYSWTYLYGERCQTYFTNCLFFARKSSANVLNLSLTSTDAVVVSLLGDEDVYTQISSNKLTAEGEDLTGVQVHSAGKNFFIERQVSETQYSSSLGVYSFGETYTHSPFTFTVTQSVVNFPNSEIERTISDSNVIGFSPFFSAQVTNDNVYPAYKKYSGQINVLVDSDLDLDGLILSNPFYSAVNMTMFPPFQGNSHYGQLVFQLEKSNTPFVTVECYQEEGSLGDIYDCSMGSLSGIFYGSFLSFSLDEFGEKKLAKPDEMSFSLF